MGSKNKAWKNLITESTVWEKRYKIVVKKYKKLAPFPPSIEIQKKKESTRKLYKSFPQNK